MSIIFTGVFAATDIKMRYKEPYVTEGLNAKLAVNTPRGIYRGFRIAPDVANRTLKVKADPDTTDHVAVYEINVGNPALQRLSLTLRKTGGDFLLDLTPLAGNTVIVSLYATYVVGSTTAAEVRIYTTAEYAALAAALRAELVVLGTCVVPAGASPIVTFDHDLRTTAWSETAGEAVPWSPVIRNPSFEWGVTGGTYRFAIGDWQNFATAGGNFQLANSAVNSRTGIKHLEFNATGGAATALIGQALEIPVQPERLVRFQLYIRVLIAPTVAALTRLYFQWGDADSVDTGVPTLIDLVTVGSTDAAYRKVEKIITVPAGAYLLKSVRVDMAAQTWSAPGIALRIDDVQVYVETRGPLALPSMDDARVGELHTDHLILEDGISAVGQLAAVARFDKNSPAGEGRVLVERRDQVAGSLPPALEVVGRLFLGQNLLATEASALLPRLSTKVSAGGGIDFTLLWEVAREDGSGTKVRFYGDPSGSLFVTVNAAWNTPSANLWNKDTAGQPATKTSFRHTQLLVEARVTDAAWTDAAWENNVITAAATGAATTAAQVSLPGQIASVGSELIATATEARIPRVAGALRPDATAFTEPTLLQQWTGVVVGVPYGFRVYVAYSTSAGQHRAYLYLVFNASWNGANWVKDQTGFPAGRLLFFSGGDFRLQWLSGVGPFTEANWTDRYGSATFNGLYLDNDNQAITGIGSHLTIQSHKTSTDGAEDLGMHLDVRPSLQAVGAVPSFVIDDLGIPRFRGGWHIEEFIQTADSATWTAFNSHTYNYQNKSRVRLVGNPGLPGYLETTGGVGIPDRCGFSADVAWETVTGRSFVGYVDAVGNIDFGFVQDSVLFPGPGSENLRGVIRTTAGLEVWDTGFDVSASLSKFLILKVYNVGPGSGAAVQWSIAVGGPDLLFASGIFVPSVSTLLNPTVSRNFRFQAENGVTLQTERCQLFTLATLI